MTNEKHYLEITPMEWSTAKTEQLVVRGPRTLSVAGRRALICLNLQAMPPEDRYALGRTIVRWATRVEAQALADIETEAQAPLF